MAKLSTNYMGLSLKNPLITGACNLSMDTDVAKKNGRCRGVGHCLQVFV